MSTKNLLFIASLIFFFVLGAFLFKRATRSTLFGVRDVATCHGINGEGSDHMHDQQQDDQQQQDLVIGTVSGYAPFVSINAAGDYEGFDIDVAHEIAQRLGKKLVLKDLGSMTSLFIALENGTIDAMMWGISITPERKKRVDFVNYHGSRVTHYPLIFWQQIPAGITTINDMHDAVVCVEPTSAQERLLDHYSCITKLPTERVDDALLNIQYKKADAALVEPAIAAKFKKRWPEIQILEVPIDPQEQEEGVGIVVKQGNESLKHALEEVVSALKREGIITQYEKKWDMMYA